MNWRTLIIALLITQLIITAFSAFDGDLSDTPLIGFIVAGFIGVLIVIVGQDWFIEDE